MKITDHINLFFNKKKLVKVNIYTEDRRVHTTVRKIESGMFTVDGKTYMIDNKMIILDGIIPTLFYMEDSIDPFDMMNGNTIPAFTADQVNKVLNNKVFSNMITSLKKKDDLITKLLIMMGGLALLLVGGLYFIYDQMNIINELLEGREALMEALRQALLQGDIGQ